MLPTCHPFAYRKWHNAHRSAVWDVLQYEVYLGDPDWSEAQVPGLS